MLYRGYEGRTADGFVFDILAVLNDSNDRGVLRIGTARHEARAGNFFALKLAICDPRLQEPAVADFKV